MLKRYDIYATEAWGDSWLEKNEEPDGEWVRYDDIKHLLARPEARQPLDRDAVRWRTLYQLDPLDFLSPAHDNSTTEEIMECLQADVDEIIDGTSPPQNNNG